MPSGGDHQQNQAEQLLLRELKNPRTRNAAFEKLVVAYQQPLYYHIRNMTRSHEDTDDILQNTFVKAWRYIEQFRGDAQLKTWLYRIATNECLTFLNRQKKRALSDLTDVQDNLAHSQTHQDTTSGEEIEARLKAAVDSLPEKQKLVFHMKYFDDLKYHEIQEILGGSVGSLKASFHHAVKKIERFLQAG